MLDKPELPDETLLACLQTEFNPAIWQVEFLPVGADNHTAVYRAWDQAGTAYFARLRSGGFDPFNLELLRYLSEQGLEPVIAPLPARNGELWADLPGYKVMLFPYIDGQNVYETSLTEAQWLAFGRTLQRLHSLTPPHELAMRIRRETFDPQYRVSLRASLDLSTRESFDEPFARRCAALLNQHRDEIQAVIARVEALLAQIPDHQLEFRLCHADLHAGNLLVGPDGRLYIIDWDELLLAPKERDLMYVGGGLLGHWRAPAEEEALFYRGYGPVEIDPVAMAYYRYERILTDLAIYAEELLARAGSREERERSFRFMASNFFPGGVLEIAREADRA